MKMISWIGIFAFAASQSLLADNLQEKRSYYDQIYYKKNRVNPSYLERAKFIGYWNQIRRSEDLSYSYENKNLIISVGRRTQNNWETGYSDEAIHIWGLLGGEKWTAKTVFDNFDGSFKNAELKSGAPQEIITDTETLSKNEMKRMDYIESFNGTGSGDGETYDTQPKGAYDLQIHLTETNNLKSWLKQNVSVLKDWESAGGETYHIWSASGESISAFCQNINWDPGRKEYWRKYFSSKKSNSKK